MLQPHPVSTESLAPPSRLAPPCFQCTWRSDGVGAAWVQVAGELDRAGAPLLAETLREAQHEAGVVVLDLRDLVFMDSAAAQVIVGASTSARRNGRQLLVVRGPVEVQRLFTLTGTAGAVEFFDLNPGEPPVQVLLELAREGIAAA